MFKKIPGFTNYSISESGEIRNDTRGKPVKSTKRRDGYRDVTLRVDKKRVRVMVHRLVAMTYLDNPSDKPQVNHKDNVRDNNHYTNLEWVTASENIRHAANQGRLNDTSGDNHGFATLTNEQVHEICSKMASGASLTKLAKEYGANLKTLSNIRTGKHWTCISSQYDITFKPNPKLSPAKRYEIALDMACGGVAKEIAGRFGVTLGTVRNCVKNIQLCSSTIEST